MPTLFWVVAAIAVATVAGYAILYISADILNYEVVQIPDRSEKAPLIIWRIVEFILSLTMVVPLVTLLLALWFCPLGRSRFFKYGRLYNRRNARNAFRLIRVNESRAERRTPVTI